ncbi:MAG: hypothetical protein M1426_00830 [Patescibacteria group bacterium]|nr:hypothetical protein [Patescibacteria group bacterium]
MGSEKITPVDMLTKIATEEGFQIEQLPPEYAGYFIPVVNQPQGQLKAVRCVDDRPVIEEEKEEALEPQIPGSSYSLVDALKMLTGVSEEEAITQIQMVSRELGYAFSTHDHCGYLKLAGDSKVNALRLTETQPPDQRFTRVDGITLHLVGEHATNAIAVINTAISARFNTTQAVNEGRPAFNFDYHFAQQAEDALVSHGQEKLAGQFASQVTRLYLRTIKALTGASTVYLYQSLQSS